MLCIDISNDIDDRKATLTKIKTFHFRYHLNDADKALFLSYAIPVLYSIWEGFVQTSFRRYLRELNGLKLSFNEIHDSILIFHMENKFKQFKEYPAKKVRKLQFFETLNSHYSSSEIDLFQTINTESNVAFKVINRILDEFNLQNIPPVYKDPYDLCRYEIEKDLTKLLKVRNTLAHGQEAVVIHDQDLQNYIKLVEILMELVYARIKKGFESQSYLSSPAL